MTVVASTSGSQNGNESIRLKAESRRLARDSARLASIRHRGCGCCRMRIPREFRERMTGLFDSLRPRNQFEISLVERAFLVEWRLDRFIRGVGSAVPEGPALAPSTNKIAWRRRFAG